MLAGHVKNEDIPLERREWRRTINISRSVKIKAPASLHLPFESFGFAGKEVLDLMSSLAKKVSESLNSDFALLLSYWKKRISTTLQVYTAKFILEASVSKRNPQRRQNIVDSALLETYHVRVT